MTGYSIKTKGIVLKTIDLKENDRIATILTEKMGKISVVMKGVKRETNRNRIFSLPFCMAEIYIYKGKSMYTFNEAILINSFQHLLEDMDRLAYGCLFCEFVDISVQEGDNGSDIFQLLVKTMYILESKGVDYELLNSYFRVQLLKEIGQGFNFKHCSNCGEPIISPYLFSLKNYSFVCKRCKIDLYKNADRLISISDNGFKALNFMNKNDIRNIVRLNFSDKLKTEIDMLLESTVKGTFYRLPKSLAFLDLIKFKE